jgi:hypothetical protein
MTSSKVKSGCLSRVSIFVVNTSVRIGAGATPGGRARRNWNRIVKMLFAILIAGLTIGFAWVLGRDRYDHVVGASVEATELWRNPWPAPGARD